MFVSLMIWALLWLTVVPIDWVWPGLSVFLQKKFPKHGKKRYASLMVIGGLSIVVHIIFSATLGLGIFAHFEFFSQG